MSPIEKIKEAFLLQDWSIIQEAFKDLTGQELESKPVKKEKKTSSVPVELDIPEVGVPDNIVKKKTGRPKKEKIGPTGGGSPPVKQSKAEDFTMPKKGNISGGKVVVNGKEYQQMAVTQIDIRNVENTFVDNGKLASADRKIDKKLQSGVRAERVRGEYNQVEANCVSCGRLAMVEPFEKKHFRCKNCMPKPG